MDLSPIRKAGVFRIVSHDPLLKSRHAGIVDHNIGDGDASGQVEPVRFLAHVQLFEPASNLGGGCGASRFVPVGEDDDSAFVMEAGRNRAPNTLRSAGDDARLILQSLHGNLEMESIGRMTTPANVLLL
jgi:hypothetical protein